MAHVVDKKGTGKKSMSQDDVSLSSGLSHPKPKPKPRRLNPEPYEGAEENTLEGGMESGDKETAEAAEADAGVKENAMLRNVVNVLLQNNEKSRKQTTELKQELQRTKQDLVKSENQINRVTIYLKSNLDRIRTLRGASPEQERLSSGSAISEKDRNKSAHAPHRLSSDAALPSDGITSCLKEVPPELLIEFVGQVEALHQLIDKSLIRSIVNPHQVDESSPSDDEEDRGDENVCAAPENTCNNNAPSSNSMGTETIRDVHSGSVKTIALLTSVMREIILKSGHNYEMFPPAHQSHLSAWSVNPVHGPHPELSPGDPVSIPGLGDRLAPSGTQFMESYILRKVLEDRKRENDQLQRKISVVKQHGKNTGIENKILVELLERRVLDSADPFPYTTVLVKLTTAMAVNVFLAKILKACFEV